jgi:uncharacterized membrane protein
MNLSGIDLRVIPFSCFSFTAQFHVKYKHTGDVILSKYIKFK